jgi:uncharacterized protein (DUF433 family)
MVGPSPMRAALNGVEMLTQGGTIPAELKSALSQNPQVMSGAICFIGTRSPVEMLLDNLKAGVGMAEFFEGYPDLNSEHVQAVIDWENGQARGSSGPVKWPGQVAHLRLVLSVLTYVDSNC